MSHYRFYSVDSKLTHRNAQKVRIIEYITKPEQGFDEEVLPMMRVKFGDGYVTECWPDELREFTAYGKEARTLTAEDVPAD